MARPAPALLEQTCPGQGRDGNRRRPPSCSDDRSAQTVIISKGLGRPTSIHKCSFYVDERVPFEESSCFACMGAPVLRAFGPSSFQLHRIDNHFTRTGGNIFWAVLLALVPGGPRLDYQGARHGSHCKGRCLNVVVLRRRKRTFWKKLSFRVHGSIGLWVAMPDSTRHGAARA